MNCPICHAELIQGKEKWICQGCEKFFEFDDPILCTDAAIDASLESVVKCLPHPLALLLEEYSVETNPYIQLHRLCDAAEMGVRFLAAVVLMEIEQGKGLATASAGLRSTLLENLERPSFGKWVGLLRAGVTELENRDRVVFDDAVRGLVGRLLELIEGPNGSGGRDTAILPLRNSLMHDGRFTEEEAIRVLEEAGHRERFESFWKDTAETFGALEMIGVTAPLEGHLLRGSPQPGDVFSTISLPPDLDYEAGTILLRSAGKVESLALTPLQVFAPVLTRLNDGSGQTEERLSVPIAQVYSRSGNHLLQFTVLHDKIGSGDGSEALQATFDALFPLSDWRRELESNELEQRAESERAAFLREATKRFRFGDIARPLLKEPFVGREADLARIIDWLDMTEQGAGVVFGHPGMGKTAVIVQLSVRLAREQSGWLCLKHIFKADDSERGSARAFLRGVLLQLEAAGGQEVEMAEDLSDHERLEKFRDALSAFSEEQLRKEKNETAGKTRLILLLDGLDECSAADQQFLFELLTGPVIPGIIWLASSRPEEEILVGLPETKRVAWLFGQEGLRELDRRAVRKFLLENLERERYALLEEESGRDQFLDALATEARSLPLYLHLLVQDLRTGRGDEYLTNPSRLPTDLTAYYDRLLAELSLDAAHKILPDVIALLAHAKTPLPEETLEELLKDHDLRDDREWSATFARSLRLGHVLLRPSHVWKSEFGHGLYHQSFRDYLLQNEERDGFPMAPVIRKARRRIDRMCRDWRDLPDKSYDRAYALRYGPIHMIELENWGNLIGDEENPTLLGDLRFIEAKCGVGLVNDLMSDYNDALAVLPEFLEENVSTRLQDEAMFRYNQALRDYAEKRYKWREGLGNATEPEYPALPSELHHAPTYTIPEERLPRASRLRHFFNFVSNHLTPLSQSPRFTLPLAFNYAKTGPVPDQAEKLIPKFQESWLRRTQRPTAQAFRPQCIRILEGHCNWVLSVSVCPDGRRAVSVSADKSLRLWDLETGECIRILEGYEGGSESVSVCPDGRRAVLACAGNPLRLWDLDSWECIRIFEERNHRCIVSVGSDGRHAVSGSDGKSLRVWDLESGECIRILEGHTSDVKCVSMCPDGRRAISAGEDGPLQLWDLESGKCTRILKGHESRVWSIRVCPDGRRAVSASDDESLRIWDLEIGKCLGTLEGHNEPVTCVSLSPDGRRAISASNGQTLRVWNLESGECIRTLEGHRRWVRSVSMCPNGRHAVSASDDKSLRIWDLNSEECPSPYEKYSCPLRNVCSDGQHAISASDGDSLGLWDLETGRCIRILDGHSGYVSGLCVYPNGGRAISASWDNSLRIWDLETGDCIRTIDRLSIKADCLSVCPDERRAFLANNSSLELWDLEIGKCIRTFKEQGQGASSVTVCPNGRRAISAKDESLRIWDLETGKCIRTLEGHSGIVRSVSVCPDGRHAVSAGFDKSLRLWDLETGVCIRTLEGHSDLVLCVGVSLDGRRAISGSYDFSLRQWDLETGVELAVFHAGSAVYSVAITTGDRIVCGTGDSQIQILTPVNFPPSGPAIITAFSATNALCPYCATEHAPSPEIVASIRSETGILSACPHCAKPLQFNPFFVQP